MNYQFFKSTGHPIVFCMIDNTDQYRISWTRELIKNQADFNITNINAKGYDILQGYDEDLLLRQAAARSYEFAVVFSTGTEFINGLSFFEGIDSLVDQQVFLAGHVLDRGDAYYELHHQCYLIDLNQYKKLGLPEIGQQTLGARHRQIIPERSTANLHDDYTPTSISKGTEPRDYNHKCHGWNIIRLALENDLPIEVFKDQIRNSKKHFYPENQQEFLKHSQWAYQRYHYCSTDLLHTANTEKINYQFKDIEQIITTASGTWWTSFISQEPSLVVFYDYNQKSLDYWKENAPRIDNISYEYVKVDLLNEDINLDFLDKNKKTMVNLSNVFAYEGTGFFYSLEHRVFKENQAIEYVKKTFPDFIINFSGRAAGGFVDLPLYDTARDFKKTDMKDLITPTWHNKEWV